MRCDLHLNELAQADGLKEPAAAAMTTALYETSTQPRTPNSLASVAQRRCLTELLRPTGVVWSTWALLSLTLIAYVARYAHNIPYYDEWGLAWVLDGRQPIDAGWLWQPVND